MAAEGGYYQMHRGWLENPAFGDDPFDRRSAWVWLIENACFRETRTNIAGKTVRLARGQLSFSMRFLARAWRWSEPAVRRFLNRLKTDAMIDAATDAGQLVITILNYNRYQLGGINSDAATDALFDAGATQERRKEEKGKNITYNNTDRSISRSSHQSDAVGDLFGRQAPAVAPDPFDAFWKAYPRKVSKKAAEKAFAAAARKIDPAAIMSALKAFPFSADPKFIPHAATWLNGERWNDKPVNGGSASGGADHDPLNFL